MLSVVEPNPLSYAPPSRNAPLWRRHFHVFLVPLAWLPGAWGSTVYHGDEFFGFAMANVASIVVLFPFFGLIERNLPIGRAMIVVVAAGFVACLAAGWLLDRLRAWRWPWLFSPVVFVLIVRSRIAMPGHVPPLAYYPGQEWERDALCVAACWTVNAIAVVLIIGAAAARAARIVKRWLMGVGGRSAR